MSSDFSACPICQSRAAFKFETQILSKYPARYFDCPHCGYLYINKPTWLAEAYSEAISSLDTGIMVRNLNASSFFSLLFYAQFRNEGPYLDYSGGYGILTRMMRDCGFDFYWEDAYCSNLLVRGFESNPHQKFFLTTALECFEHFEDPVQHFESIFHRSRNLIISTELLPEPMPQPTKWHYYCLNTGQHIGFYRPRTLRWVAKRFGKFFYVVGNFQLFLEQPVSGFKMRTMEFVSRKLPVYKFIQKLNGCLAYTDPGVIESANNKSSFVLFFKNGTEIANLVRQNPEGMTNEPAPKSAQKFYS